MSWYHTIFWNSTMLTSQKHVHETSNWEGVSNPPKTNLWLEYKNINSTKKEQMLKLEKKLQSIAYGS